MPELRLPFFAHGGDYNPDQWRHIPGTLEEDVRLMKLAHCNLTVSYTHLTLPTNSLV